MIKVEINDNEKDFLASELRRVGLVATQPRMKIFSVFYSAKDSQLAVFDIYRFLQKNNIPVSISTIYNALNNLAKTGILVFRKCPKALNGMS